MCQAGLAASSRPLRFLIDMNPFPSFIRQQIDGVEGGVGGRPGRAPPCLADQPGHEKSKREQRRQDDAQPKGQDGIAVAKPTEHQELELQRKLNQLTVKEA